MIEFHLCVSLRRETDGVSGNRKSCGDKYLSHWLTGSFVRGRWPRMKSNTYIKREGTRELPYHEAVASYLTRHPVSPFQVLWSAIFLHHRKQHFPKGKQALPAHLQAHFRSLSCVKNKETSEKVTCDLWGLSDFFIHSHTNGFYFFMSKGESLTVIE